MTVLYREQFQIWDGKPSKDLSFRFDTRVIIQLMSIYSGFATRFQQQAYDHCIDSLLYILQKRIIKFYQGETADQEKFISVVLKLHQQMRNMQKNKYLQPKSSQSISELIKFMHIYQQNFSNSTHKESSIQPQLELVQQTQSLKQTEEIKLEKKKVSMWVEKPTKIEENSEEQSKQIDSDILKNNNRQEHKRENQHQLQFKRTAPINNQLIHAINPKISSRTNLSRDKQSALTGVPPRADKNRSVSGLIYQKQPTAHSKASFKHHPQAQSINMTRKRKIKSINKSFNQLQSEPQVKNEVSDIIKEYIIKTKRSRVLSRNSKHQLEYLGKLNDF